MSKANLRIENILIEFDKKWYDREFDGDEFMGVNGYESDPCCEEVQKWLKDKLTSLVAQGIEQGRAQEREDIKKSVELWMDVHEKQDKSFTTDDFIKFITEEL